MGIKVCSILACRRLFPPCAGGTEPWRLGETLASTPSQLSALGSKSSEKWQREKREISFFSLYWAQLVPALGALVGHSAGQRSLDLPLGAATLARSCGVFLWLTQFILHLEVTHCMKTDFIL